MLLNKSARHMLDAINSYIWY